MPGAEGTLLQLEPQLFSELGFFDHSAQTFGNRPPLMGVHRDTAPAKGQLSQSTGVAAQARSAMPQAFGHRQAKPLLKRGVHTHIRIGIGRLQAFIRDAASPRQGQSQLTCSPQHGDDRRVRTPTDQLKMPVVHTLTWSQVRALISPGGSCAAPGCSPSAIAEDQSPLTAAVVRKGGHRNRNNRLSSCGKAPCSARKQSKSSDWCANYPHARRPPQWPAVGGMGAAAGASA